MLKFITGNKNKFGEVLQLLGPIPVEMLDVSLDEIQDIDPRRIIKHKLQEAFKHHGGPFMIEDSSLVIEAFGKKLPGPFIKFFNEYLTPKGIAEIAVKMKKQKATGSVTLAYAKNSKDVVFFTGKIHGKIVMPRGKYGFGYDPIFLPNGSAKTLGELKAKGNFDFSARGQAVRKLKKFIDRK